jgi:translation initiation factor 1|uniref:SUI1 domain-containing protein n=1 Tax=Zea mays TaxID=4577 RepID=C0P922_MAIZE|nr:unknown [Zea mays]
MLISVLFASDGMASSLIDPFAEANAEDSGAGPGTKDYVHVRIQQRNGRKSLTTVQGLKKEFSYNKILKDLKKEFCCNGTVVQDPELGQVRYENNAFQACKNGICRLVDILICLSAAGHSAPR